MGWLWEEVGKHSVRLIYNWGSICYVILTVPLFLRQFTGYIQLACHKHHCDLHTVKPNECYIDWLAVLASARGKGVGTKLIAWAEERARERGCDR